MYSKATKSLKSSDVEGVADTTVAGSNSNSVSSNTSNIRMDSSNIRCTIRSYTGYCSSNTTTVT